MRQVLQIMKPLLQANMVTPQMASYRLQCNQSGKVPKKILRLQKQFQAKNDLPVFLKGGSSDKILYYTTLGLCGLGLSLDLLFFAGYIID